MQNPCHRTCQAGTNIAAFSCCNGSGDSSSRKFCHTCHHRKKTVSHSLNSISQHIDKIQRNKEQCHTFYIDCYHGKHFFNIIRDKQICEIFSRKEQKTSYNNRIYNSYKMRSPESFAHSFKFSGSDVLCVVGSAGSSLCHKCLGKICSILLPAVNAATA